MKKTFIALLLSMALVTVSQAANTVVEIVEVDETPELATATDITNTEANEKIYVADLVTRWKGEVKSAKTIASILQVTPVGAPVQ